MPDEKTPQELFQRQLNLGRAMERIHRYIQTNAKPDGSFIVNVENIIALHSICMEKLLDRPGVYREVPVNVGPYTPPPVAEVQQNMRDFIGELNEKWSASTVPWIGAYALWRLNWIHPFLNGNGRTARLFSYFLMNMKAGYLFPGKPGNLIPEQLGGNLREDYVHSLRKADKGSLTELEKLISKSLHNQLSNV